MFDRGEREGKRETKEKLCQDLSSFFRKKSIALQCRPRKRRKGYTVREGIRPEIAKGTQHVKKRSRSGRRLERGKGIGGLRGDRLPGDGLTYGSIEGGRTEKR